MARKKLKSRETFTKVLAVPFDDEPLRRIERWKRGIENERKETPEGMPKPKKGNQLIRELIMKYLPKLEDGLYEHKARRLATKKP